MEQQNSVHSGKKWLDKAYDILTVQIIAASVFVIAALIIKLCGGEFYSDISRIYHLHIDKRVSVNELYSDADNNISSEEPLKADDTDDSESGIKTDVTSEDTALSDAQKASAGLLQTSAPHQNGKNRLIWSVDGKITCEFGKRSAPVSGASTYHEGIDIGAEWGTPILAAADGTVYFVGESEGYGKYIMVSHGGNFISLYAHCSEIYSKTGDIVSQGDKIAAVGNTGRATGSHLHFETRVGGKPIDPRWLLPERKSV